MVVSPISVDSRPADRGPANKGAGGSGRTVDPLYFDEGVPGRGLPLMSAGSYGILDGGGRTVSEDIREGDNVRVGELRRGMNGKYDGASVMDGGAIVGA